MSTSSQPDDLASLAVTFPEWTFSARWTAVPSGPDARYLEARKGGVTVQAATADALAAHIAAAVITAALRGDDAS